MSILFELVIVIVPAVLSTLIVHVIPATSIVWSVVLSSLIVIDFELLVKVTDVTTFVSCATLTLTSFLSSHEPKLVDVSGTASFVSVVNEFIILATSFQVESVVLAITLSVDVVVSSVVALVKLLNLIAFKLVMLPNGNEVVVYSRVLVSVALTPTNPKLDQLTEVLP